MKKITLKVNQGQRCLKVKREADSHSGVAAIPWRDTLKLR